MIEIVFGESACGSLKIAQTYGKGKYRGSAVSIFMRHEDGSVPSSDEMKKAQLQAQEQERIAWENAIPLGGKSCDVYCFDMALSVGDISDNGIGEQRKNIFKKMLSVCFVEDLDADKQYLNNLPAITPFTDRIKEYLTPFEEEQNQNLTKTSSNDLDELCIFEKDMFKLFCTDEFNTYLIRMVNSFVIKAVNGGKRVLIISPFSTTKLIWIIAIPNANFFPSYISFNH